MTDRFLKVNSIGVLNAKIALKFAHRNFLLVKSKKYACL
jgi:hypothetical protein